VNKQANESQQSNTLVVLQKIFIMYRNIIILFIALSSVASCTKPVKNEFIITGSVDTGFDGYVLLQKRTDGPLITVDSMMLSTGKFRFNGTLDYPEVYYLTIPGTKSSVPFFLEPSEITIDINTRNIDKTRIEGSVSQKEYDAYLDILDQYNAKVKENYQMFMKAKEIGDAAKTRQFDSLTKLYDQQRGEFSKKFVMENPRSFITPYITYRNSWNYELEDLDAAVSNFDTTLNHSIYTGYLQEYLKTLKRTEVGMLYVSFMMQDTTGLYLPISDLIGDNYLLVDFWASWCAPCREENPNLVAMYNKYHEKGFDILGISLDSSRERWLKAIKDDNLTWHHVSDLEGWDNKAAKLYGVRSIPANILLDSSGYIIDKNLRGEDLQKKLEELFPETQQASRR
jgi:peroxiredoxin